MSRAWEVEKPWLKDEVGAFFSNQTIGKKMATEARAMAIMAAIHRFESARTRGIEIVFRHSRSTIEMIQ